MHQIYQHNSKGFTLVELSVVLLLIALLAALVFPAIPYITEEGLKSSARELASFFRGVFASTLETGGDPLRLKIEIEENRFDLEHCAPVEEGVCEWESTNKEFEVGMGTEIDSIRAGMEEFTSGELYIPISRNTGGIPILVTLRKGNDHYSVFYNSFTGEVEIHEGEVEIFYYEKE